MTDQEIANLFPPSSRQNPLLRQLMGQVYGDDDDSDDDGNDDDAGQVMEDFLSSLTPPPRRQNPLLRQLPATAATENIADLAPPGYRQNPLHREEISQYISI